MNKSLRCAAGVLAATMLPGPVSSQTSDRQAAAQPYASAATAILVDVVVRDRKGRPITDLSLEDFALAEDGVPQKLDTFSRVSRGAGIGLGVAWRTPETISVARADSAPPIPEPSDSSAEGGTTALVFDRLTADSLRLAQRAVLAYVPMSGDSGVRLGVFATDPGVRVLQTYTTERALVRQAVASLAPSGNAGEEQQQKRLDDLMARRRQLDDQTRIAVASASNISGASLAAAGAEIGERENERRLVQTELNMLRSFETLDRDYRGYDTSRILLSVIQSLAHLPGRKTIVFFSEGLPVSPALTARLDTVIEAANRAQVTAYAVDAHGLRTHSASENMFKEMQAFVEERTSQLTSGTDRTDQPLSMGFERVEDTFKLDSRTGLARLAEDTGGFLVEGSNDLTSAFQRIDEDRQFHYLLTYAPRNANFDGKFRRIAVKVRRPDTRIFARRGYRAIRNPAPVDADGYERPAIALLDRKPLPNAFAVHAAGFSFPDPARPGLTPLLVRVKTDVLRFVIDPQTSRYAGQLTIVVRLRDASGREVQKVSQQYLLAGEAKDVEAARNGEILFYREPDLPPGLYTMESIAFDALADAGSARIATLSVPPAGGGLSLSSLIVVNRVEETEGVPSAAPPGSAPLYVGRQLVYPNVGEPIRRTAATDLLFYFAAYGTIPDGGVHAQLLRNGAVVAEAPVAVPAAAASRVQHLGRLPIGALPSGTYELRIFVRSEAGEISRTAFFTLSD